MFISIEGIDGAGKTEVISQVKKELTLLGYSVVVLHEPGTTEMGKEIRKLVKSDIPRNKISELLLFEASRADMVETVIKPAINKYDYVLIDRYIDSTIAYQGYGNGNSMSLINTLNDFATQGISPDKRLLIDVSLETAQERQALRNEKIDHFESDTTFAKRVYKGYHEIEQTTDMIKISNEGNINTTVQTIIKILTE